MRSIESSDFEAREFGKSDANAFLYEKPIFEDFGTERITIMDYQDTLADESDTQYGVAEKISAENSKSEKDGGWFS